MGLSGQKTALEGPDGLKVWQKGDFSAVDWRPTIQITANAIVVATGYSILRGSSAADLRTTLKLLQTLTSNASTTN